MATIQDHLPKDGFSVITPRKQIKFKDYSLPWAAAYGLHCIRLWTEDCEIERRTGTVPPSRFLTPEEFRRQWDDNGSFAAAGSSGRRTVARTRLIPEWMVDNLVAIILTLKSRVRPRYPVRRRHHRERS